MNTDEHWYTKGFVEKMHSPESEFTAMSQKLPLSFIKVSARFTNSLTGCKGVTQIFDLLYRRFVSGRIFDKKRPAFGAVARLAECNYAIQQIENLRYWFSSARG